MTRSIYPGLLLKESEGLTFDSHAFSRRPHSSDYSTMLLFHETQTLSVELSVYIYRLYLPSSSFHHSHTLKPFKTRKLKWYFILNVLVSMRIIYTNADSVFLTLTVSLMTIPVAQRSKVKVWGRSFAGIAGSNRTEGIDVCVVRYSYLRGANPSSRVLLPTVVCHRVWSRNIKNEVALAGVGLLRQTKKIHS